MFDLLIYLWCTCDIITNELAGRARKKKCDQQAPVCGLCNRLKYKCQWPTSAELIDRRYLSHQESRYATKSRIPSTEVEITKREIVEPHSSPLPAFAFNISLLSELVAYHHLSSDLEIVISKHFAEKYCGLLLLPNSHPKFYDVWLTGMFRLIPSHNSLRYSVLANGASHLHLVDKNDSMYELALTYYSSSLQHLVRSLDNEQEAAKDNGLLMSVMLLYLHGCQGRGTYTDIPTHVSAATRILSMRLLSSQLSIKRPFDRLAVESVLYQIFSVSTGLWFEDPPLVYQFDPQFWLRAEQLLDQSVLLPDGSNSLNSPVLGVPVSLYRLTLFLKQQFRQVRDNSHNPSVLEGIRSEIQGWETLVICDQDLSSDEQTTQAYQFQRDGSYLFVLTISLLLEQIEHSVRNLHVDARSDLPEIVSPACWQITKAREIIQRRQHDDAWKTCFIGSWPVYTLGSFMSSIEDIELLRAEMMDRWRLTGFSQISRYMNDLESIWARRGFRFTDAKLEARPLDQLEP